MSQIEKGVPMPERKAPRWAPLVKAMVAGDSYVCDCLADAHGLVTCLHRNGYRSLTAPEQGEPAGRVRVWHNGLLAVPVAAPEKTV